MARLQMSNYLTRRSFARGIVAAVALAAVVSGSTTPTLAETTSGRITINAQMCVYQTDQGHDYCWISDVGALSLAETGPGSAVLAMDEASLEGSAVVWGDIADVPLTSYMLDTQYMNVPNGFNIADLIPDYGDAGTTENGMYVTVTADSPEVSAYVTFRPAAGADSDDDGLNDAAEITLGSDPYDANDMPKPVQAGPDDSDGDGANDDDEIAWGSDPYDASDFPAVQAGPEPDDSDGDGASDEAEYDFGSDPFDASDYPEVQAGPEPSNETVGDTVVTSLPNTGAGFAGDDADTTGSILSLIGGAVALGGGFTLLRRRQTRI